MNILLCVTGSVSCILTDKLAKALSIFGCVKIALSHSATKFLTKDNFTFNGEVYSDSDELKWVKRGDPIYHIELSKWADALVVAPLTANSLATFAAGMSNSLISNIVRAWDFRKPAIFALSMNPQMLVSHFTAQHKSIMEKIGAIFVPTQTKKMMCGDIGDGAMADINLISQYLWSNIVNKFGQNVISQHANWVYTDLPKDLKNKPLWFEETATAHNASICGGYLEDRSPLFDSRHDASKPYHLGVDFWADEYVFVGFPYGRGKVVNIYPDSGTKGGWGNRVDIEIDVNGKPYIAIFAHLDSILLPDAGTELSRGKIFATLGDRSTNGGWKPHLHLQVINKEMYIKCPDFDAYAALDDEIMQNSLNPITLM